MNSRTDSSSDSGADSPGSRNAGSASATAPGKAPENPPENTPENTPEKEANPDTGCDQVSSLLFDYAGARLDEPTQEQVGTHLDECPDCAAGYHTIASMQTMANVWHDETPPPWQAPALSRKSAGETFLQWFPGIASATALILVLALYLAPLLPTAGRPALAAHGLQPEVTEQSALVHEVLASTRSQRQEELQALVILLKAEMDRRSLDTEDSLRYIIAHQITEQRRLDDLSRKVQPANYTREMPQ